MKPFFSTLLGWALLTSAAHADLKIDGVPNEPEWQTARHITDFKVVQPLTKGDSQHPMEVWLLPTPEGLAVAFHSSQDASAPRSRQRTQRDQFGSVDRVNLVVDYDGEGGTGYNFTLTGPLSRLTPRPGR